MKINVRMFNAFKDYDMMWHWWKSHGSYPPKLEHLSPNGLVVEVEEEAAAIGFLYKTDSKICIFEFVVSNPVCEKEKRDIGIMNLINAAKIWAYEQEFSLIYTSVRGLKYISRLMENGFIRVDDQQTHLFFNIKEGSL